MDKRYYQNHSSLIFRLADTAHDISFAIYQQRTKTEKADQVIFYDIFNKIFAELIIEECAKVVIETPVPYENEDIKNQYGHTWIMACNESRKRIKQHFGVNSD